MQAIRDQLNHHSLMIIALEEKVQIGFGNINTRFDDLTFTLKVLGLHANMNQEKTEAGIEETLMAPVPKPICANTCG
jgi:hypothetical protein